MKQHSRRRSYKDEDRKRFLRKTGIFRCNLPSGGHAVNRFCEREKQIEASLLNCILKTVDDCCVPTFVRYQCVYMYTRHIHFDREKWWTQRDPREIQQAFLLRYDSGTGGELSSERDFHFLLELNASRVLWAFAWVSKCFLCLSLVPFFLSENVDVFDNTKWT